MADLNVPSDNLSRNHLSRRRALQGAASVTALAIPAGVALGIEASKIAQAAAGPAELPGGADPHIAWWAELREIRADCAVNDWSDDLTRRECDLEDLISTTAPTTLEGAAIVATMIVVGHTRMYPDGSAGLLEPEDTAGETLARHILATTPADVLRRAGLEV